MITPTTFNDTIHLHGDCTGVIPEGTELTAVDLEGYGQPGMEQPYKGPRPKRGLKYTVNGLPVFCSESRIKNGNEYSPSWWEYVLRPIV